MIPLMKLNFIIPIVLICFTFTNAFADVTVGGIVTFGTGTANIIFNGTITPITVESISSSSSGIQTRATTADNFHTFQFSSATNPSPSIQFKSLSSTEADFTVLTPVVDLIGTTLGDSLTRVNVDSTEIGFTFLNQINQFTVNAGKFIQEFFVGLPTGGGSGGPSGLPIAQTPEAKPITTIISVEPKSYQLPLGIVLPSETFQFTWNSTQDVYLESAQIGNSPIQVSLPNTPLLLKGNTLDLTGSKSLVPFSLAIPWNTCSSGVATTCVDPINYDIPVTFSIITNGQKSLITTNVHVEPQTNPFPIILTLILLGGMIVAGSLLLKPLIKHRKKAKEKNRSKTRYDNTREKLKVKIHGKNPDATQESLQIIRKEIEKIENKKPEKKKDNRPDNEIEKFSKNVEKESHKRLKKLDKKGWFSR